ncbi:MAG: SEC-C metal-binding domain-containing protein [Nitrososphaeraceae archaeon]
MRPNRNDICPCGSNKKFKDCCIELHNERMRWGALEVDLREKVDEYWKEFYHDRYVDQALDIYSKDVSCDMSDVFDRRLFFDWFIHDYVIPDKKDTIIRLFIKECENELDDIERNTAIAWSKSELRFYEILEVKRGTGYEVKDILNEARSNNQFFVFDKSSSEKANKYDIQYMRVYPVGSINRITGVGILMPRRYLPYIKDYVLHNSKLFNKKGGELTESKIIDDSITACESHDDIYYDYFKKESLSILKYLESLKLNPTVTTSQGDTIVLARSRYIVKNKRRLISLLNSSKQFVRLENEGKRSIRYDWVEKINKKDLIGTMSDSAGLEHLSLNTILWMPSPDSEEDKDYDRNYISTTNNTDVNKEVYIPYRVLGNLSITGRNLQVECLSDKLLENCNCHAVISRQISFACW